jgi:hypothetical protein
MLKVKDYRGVLEDIDGKQYKFYELPLTNDTLLLLSKININQHSTENNVFKNEKTFHQRMSPMHIEILLILIVLLLWILSILLCLRRYSLLLCFKTRDIPYRLHANIHLKQQALNQQLLLIDEPKQEKCSFKVENEFDNDRENNSLIGPKSLSNDENLSTNIRLQKAHSECKSDEIEYINTSSISTKRQINPMSSFKRKMFVASRGKASTSPATVASGGQNKNYLSLDLMTPNDLMSINSLQNQTPTLASYDERDENDVNWIPNFVCQTFLDLHSRAQKLSKSESNIKAKKIFMPPHKTNCLKFSSVNEKQRPKKVLSLQNSNG